ATLNRARSAVLAAYGERREPGSEQTEHVQKDGTADDAVLVLGEHQDQHRYGERPGDAEQGRSAPALRNDRLEQVQRELREQHREHRGRPLPNRAATAVVLPLGEVPETYIAREGSEQHLGTPRSTAKQHGGRDREREHPAEQRRAGPEIHTARLPPFRQSPC